MKKRKGLLPWVVIGIAVLLIILVAVFGGFSKSGQVTRAESSTSFSTTNTQTSTQDVLCEQEYLNSASTPLWIGDPINKRKQILTYTDIPGLLDDGNFAGNVDAVFIQTLEIGRNKIMNSSPTQIFIEMNLGPGNSLYTYHITFNKAVNFTHPDPIVKWITLMGQDYAVGFGAGDNSLALLRSPQQVDLSLGGVFPESKVVNVENKIYTVELISVSEGQFFGDPRSAIIKVTDSSGGSNTKEIRENSAKLVQGLYVGVISVDENVVNNSMTASLLIGAEGLQLINNMPVRKGYDLINGTSVIVRPTGNWDNVTDFSINFFAPDSAHNKIYVAQTHTNPLFNNLKTIFDSYDNTNGAIIRVGGCVAYKSCLDSDGGNVPLTRGTMTYLAYFGYNWTDSCASTSFLSEYYCSPEDTPLVGKYNCAYGCIDGRCKPAPSSSCYYDKKLRAYVCK